MDKLFFGLEVAALGMGIVFVALIILSYLTSLLSRVVGGNKETAASKIEGVGEKKTDQIRVPEKESVPEDRNHELTPELIAVITAAVFESLGSTKYRITAIREIPKDKPTAWSHAGRMEQMKSILN